MTRNKQTLLVGVAVFAVAGLAIYTADFRPDALKNALGTQAMSAATNASGAVGANGANGANGASAH